MLRGLRPKIQRGVGRNRGDATSRSRRDTNPSGEEDSCRLAGRYTLRPALRWRYAATAPPTPRSVSVAGSGTSGFTGPSSSLNTLIVSQLPLVVMPQAPNAFCGELKLDW